MMDSNATTPSLLCAKVTIGDLTYVTCLGRNSNDAADTIAIMIATVVAGLYPNLSPNTAGGKNGKYFTYLLSSQLTQFEMLTHHK